MGVLVTVYFTLTVLVLVLAHLDSNEHLVGTRDLVENAIALAGSNRKTDLKYMKGERQPAFAFSGGFALLNPPPPGQPGPRGPTD